MKSFKQFISEAMSNIDTPEFKRWFGNSKVVDAEGNPLIVYHGTRFDFSVFDTQDVPVWFSEEPDLANDRYAYGESDDAYENVMPVYIKLSNPKILEGDMDDVGDNGNPYHETIHNWDYMQKLKHQGYDGIIINEDGYRTFAVFSPTQIKSIFNNGNFDLHNPNISEGIN